MAFKISTYNKNHTTKYGEPYLWGSGDVTTLPSNETKITASDGAADDSFGGSVAVGCGRIVVGAYQDDDNGSASGSAYIFDLDGNQLTKITASDGVLNDFFGESVAIGSGRIVVGAYGDDDNGSQSGSAYIFDLDGTQLAKITASDGDTQDRFGGSVAVGCGRIVVGAEQNSDNGSYTGSAYIFDLDGTQLAKIMPSDAAGGKLFGRSVAVGSGRIVVGAFGDSTAYIFDLDGTQLAKITASDGPTNNFFGNSVAVGNGRIVVGADDDDDNGSNSGAAYIFDINGTQLAKITASDGADGDRFGEAVAVGNGRIVVGAWADDDNASASGSAYVFDLDGNQLAKITASDGDVADLFSKSAVAIGNGRIVVGAYQDDVGANENQGSAYIYETPRVYTPYDLIYNEV